MFRKYLNVNIEMIDKSNKRDQIEHSDIFMALTNNNTKSLYIAKYLFQP